MPTTNLTAPTAGPRGRGAMTPVTWTTPHCQRAASKANYRRRAAMRWARWFRRTGDAEMCARMVREARTHARAERAAALES